MPARRPIWLMRQAGRYLPEYREVRAQAGSFLRLCYTPSLAAEVTLQPLRRFDLDAAILFADILVVPHAMGLALDFKEGEGPVLDTVSNLEEVGALADGVGSEAFTAVCETVRRVASELPQGKALIGFCGAPWTVASYMIEGRGAERALAVKTACENPPWFAALMDRLVETSVHYLVEQIKAGAQAVQIFDSWAGDIPAAHRNRVVERPIARMVEGMRAAFPDFPVIVFGRGVDEKGHVSLAKATHASAVSVEQGISIAALLNELPSGVAVQGNLAPETLLGSADDVRAGVRSVVQGVPMARHVFNLGHGIVPQVKPEMVTVLVDEVRRLDQGQA